MLLVIKGTAGTGKSYVINAIRSAAEHISPGATLQRADAIENSGQVCVAAPTGTAAFNVGGVTLHSLLSLGRQQNKPQKPLNGNAKNSAERRLGCAPTLRCVPSA